MSTDIRLIGQLLRPGVDDPSKEAPLPSVRINPNNPPDFRDRLARDISNSYSLQPGRLCLVQQDYDAADSVIQLLKAEGILP